MDGVEVGICRGGHVPREHPLCKWLGLGSSHSQKAFSEMHSLLSYVQSQGYLYEAERVVEIES